jgi:O-antigen ligase
VIHTEALRRPTFRIGPAFGQGLASVSDAAILPALVGVISFATVSQGGFYRAQAVLMAAALGALAMSSVRSIRGLGPYAAAFGCLAAGIASSAIVAGSGPGVVEALAALGCAAATVPAVVRVVARGERTRLMEAFAWIGATASAVGIVAVALHRAPWAIRAQGLWRNASTLTYPNAAGALFLLTLGACALVLVERSTRARRVAAFLVLCGFATTLSRGAFVGAVVAVIVLAASRRARVLAPLGRPAVGALVACAALVPSIAASEPSAASVVVGLAGVATGAAIASGSSRLRARTLVGLALMAALATAPAAGRVLERRALPGSETRLSTWRTVWNLALERPVFGTGPGTFLVVEDSADGPGLTRFAHNEYLQAFSETGAVGVASIAVAIAVLAGGALRRRRADPAWAVGFAVCAAFTVHGAIDFVWRFPLLVVLGFAWLAVSLTPSPREGEHHEG